MQIASEENQIKDKSAPKVNKGFYEKDTHITAGNLQNKSPMMTVPRVVFLKI